MAGADLPVFVMEIVLVERANELFVLLFNRQQIDLVSVLLVVRIEIVRKKHTDVIETLHFILICFNFLVTLSNAAPTICLSYCFISEPVKHNLARNSRCARVSFLTFIALTLARLMCSKVICV